METWADLQQVGLGDLGLLPDQFWQLTYRELAYMAAGHSRRTLETWRRTRWLGTLIVNINRGPDTPAYSPEDLLELPGDPPPPPGPSQEEINALAAEVLALDADLVALK